MSLLIYIYIYFFPSDLQSYWFLARSGLKNEKTIFKTSVTVFHHTDLPFGK